jgi:hypothetical protein
MQIENYTIATTVEELKEVVQHCIIHEMQGRVNLTISGADINVWQPSNQPCGDEVVPKHIALEGGTESC